MFAYTGSSIYIRNGHERAFLSQQAAAIRQLGHNDEEVVAGKLGMEIGAYRRACWRLSS